MGDGGANMLDLNLLKNNIHCQVKQKHSKIISFSELKTLLHRHICKSLRIPNLNSRDKIVDL